MCWIKDERIWKQYVQNRVNEIRKLSSKDWKYCPGSLNPADLPFWGLSANELLKAKIWWHGPQCLKEDNTKWPTTPHLTESKEAYNDLAKTKPNVTHFLSTKSTIGSEVITMDNFGSKTRLARIYPWVQSFIAVLNYRVEKEPRSENFKEALCN